MPIPKPSKGEKESDFISRCMGNAVMVKDYPKQKQRAGVCYTQWKDVHGSAETEAEFMESLEGRKVTLNGRSLPSRVRIETAMQVRNATLFDVGSAAQENDPFAKLGYAPDRWKAYMDFDIVHCAPAIIGPVQEGFYSTYLPKIAAASHSSLLHQQMNLNHLLKEYSKDDKEISRDRIVGCVVATWFPDEPVGGWKIGDDAEQAPAIRARAVIFKLADGVNRIIGDHQASRNTQSVSIESITSIDNLGVYLPSRGVDKMAALVDLDKDPELMSALSLDPLSLGKVNGEQAVFVFGIKEPVQFRGVGITPRPAEREAKIISFEAQKPRTSDGGTLIAMAADLIDQEILGRKVIFRSTGRTGIIDQVWNEGEARLPDMAWRMKATAAEPVVKIKLPDGRPVLRRMSELKGIIEQ
jgi:hypothetical protein